MVLLILGIVAGLIAYTLLGRIIYTVRMAKVPKVDPTDIWAWRVYDLRGDDAAVFAALWPLLLPVLLLLTYVLAPVWRFGGWLGEQAVNR